VAASERHRQMQAKGGKEAYEALFGRGGLCKKFRWRVDREGIIHDWTVAHEDPKPSLRRRAKRRRNRGRQEG
jgi:hypothetical protein